MRSGPRFFLASLFLLIIVTGCSGAEPPAPAPGQTPPASEAPSPAPPPAVDELRPLAGFRAPNIIARDVVTNEPVNLASLKGQAVMLNFWATWCGPCRVEMPAMEELHKEAGGRVRILALGADSYESPEKLAKFGADLGLTFPLVHDGGEGAEKYRVMGIPTTFFIDQDGVIRVKHQGQMTLQQMRNAVAEAESKGK